MSNHTKGALCFSPLKLQTQEDGHLFKANSQILWHFWPISATTIQTTEATTETTTGKTTYISHGRMQPAVTCHVAVNSLRWTLGTLGHSSVFGPVMSFKILEFAQTNAKKFEVGSSLLPSWKQFAFSSVFSSVTDWVSPAASISFADQNLRDRLHLCLCCRFVPSDVNSDDLEPRHADNNRWRDFLQRNLRPSGVYMYIVVVLYASTLTSIYNVHQQKQSVDDAHTQ